MSMTRYHEDERHVGVFAARTPDRPALIDASDGSVVIFAEYEALSNQCAHLLRASGLGPGDCLAIFMENNVSYLPLVWGGWRAGLRVTAVATHLGPEEVEYIVENSGAKALMTSSSLADTASALKLAGVRPEARFMLNAVPGFVDLGDALAAQSKTPIADQAEGVDLLYSSGTTGRPKGVKKRMPDTPFGIPTAWHLKMMELYRIDERAIYLHPAPLYHAAPLMFNLRINRFGGTSVITKKFDAEQALALIERYRVTHSQWVPTHFIRLLRLPAETRAKYDLSSHKVAIHAAASCPVDVKRQIVDWWGPIAYEYYAGSEGNGYVASNTEEWLAKPGTVGREMLGKLRICDDNGREVETGTPGTIYFEGGQTFEYYNDPEKTAASRNDQGWSTLGDVGYVDQDGYLFLTDRKAFMIVSGGVNIYPQECENLLATHPAVMDVAVIGVPHPDFGEEVKAVVQPVDMANAGQELEAELIDFCRASLSHVKCPRSIDFVERLPRQENGKLYKRKLRDAYWEGHESRIV